MPREGRSHTKGFTLFEVLVVLTLLGILVGVSVALYRDHVDQARSVEAAQNLSAIHGGEVLQELEHGAFIEAADLPAINTALHLELTARYFDYQVRVNEDTFLATATPRFAAATPEPIVITMDQTRTLRRVSGSAISGSGVGGIGGVGGGVLVGTGGFPTPGGAGGVNNAATGQPPIPTGTPLVPISNWTDRWINWADLNPAAPNIIGTVGIGALTEAFQLVAGSALRFVTDALSRKGIPISFGTESDFSGRVANAIAFLRAEKGAAGFPKEPDSLPFIKFKSGLRE